MKFLRFLSTAWFGGERPVSEPDASMLMLRIDAGVHFFPSDGSVPTSLRKQWDEIAHKIQEIERAPAYALVSRSSLREIVDRVLWMESERAFELVSIARLRNA